MSDVSDVLLYERASGSFAAGLVKRGHHIVYRANEAKGCWQIVNAQDTTLSKHLDTDNGARDTIVAQLPLTDDPHRCVALSQDRRNRQTPHYPLDASSQPTPMPQQTSRQCMPLCPATATNLPRAWGNTLAQWACNHALLQRWRASCARKWAISQQFPLTAWQPLPWVSMA